MGEKWPEMPENCQKMRCKQGHFRRFCVVFGKNVLLPNIYIPLNHMLFINGDIDFTREKK